MVASLVRVHRDRTCNITKFFSFFYLNRRGGWLTCNSTDLNHVNIPPLYTVYIHPFTRFENRLNFNEKKRELANNKLKESGILKVLLSFNLNPPPASLLNFS